MDFEFAYGKPTLYIDGVQYALEDEDVEWELVTPEESMVYEAWGQRSTASPTLTYRVKAPIRTTTIQCTIAIA